MRRFAKVQSSKNTFFFGVVTFFDKVSLFWRSDSLPMSHWSSDAFLRADNKWPLWWGEVSKRRYFGEVTPTLKKFCTMTDEFLSMGPGFFVFYGSFVEFVLIDNFHRMIIFSSQLFRYDTFTDWGLFWIKILKYLEFWVKQIPILRRALLVHKRSRISISPSGCFLTSHFA